MLVWGTNMKRPLLRGLGARADQALSRKVIAADPGNRGKPRLAAISTFNRPAKLSPSLTVSLCYAFLRFGSAKVKALSGTATL